MLKKMEVDEYAEKNYFKIMQLVFKRSVMFLLRFVEFGVKYINSDDASDVE